MISGVCGRNLALGFPGSSSPAFDVVYRRTFASVGNLTIWTETGVEGKWSDDLVVDGGRCFPMQRDCEDEERRRGGEGLPGVPAGRDRENPRSCDPKDGSKDRKASRQGPLSPYIDFSLFSATKLELENAEVTNF